MSDDLENKILEGKIITPKDRVNLELDKLIIEGFINHIEGSDVKVVIRKHREYVREELEYLRNKNGFNTNPE